MKTTLLLSVCILLLGFLPTACDYSEASFSSDVQPIFIKNCIKCHNGGGEGVAASGFSVVSYDRVMKGTTLGKVVAHHCRRKTLPRLPRG